MEFRIADTFTDSLARLGQRDRHELWQYDLRQRGARASGYTLSTPMYAPNASIGVRVFMLRADEPQAQGSFDAAKVLRSKSD